MNTGSNTEQAEVERDCRYRPSVTEQLNVFMHLPSLETLAVLTVGPECLCFPHTSAQSLRPTQKPHDLFK